MFKYLAVGAIAAFAVYQNFFADDRDDSPPGRSQSRESSQPRVHRRDGRQYQNIDSSQSHESSQPQVHRRNERQYQSINSSQLRESSQPQVHRRDGRQYQNIDSSQSHESSQPQVHRRNERQYQSISSSQSHGSSQPQVHQRDERQYQSIDSSQGDYTPVEAYSSLRDRAKQEGDLRAKYFKQSNVAYQRGDHAHAKALSEEGKRHALKRDKLNAQASAIIFQENNQNKTTCKIDLHGLSVKEAITYSEKAIREARSRGDTEIRLIVGQGTHSDGGVARLKPAIRKTLRKRGFNVEVHSTNPGVLVVQLGSK